MVVTEPLAQTPSQGLLMTSGVALEDCCGAADLLQMSDVMMVDNGANSVGAVLNNSVISVTMPGASSPTSMLQNNGAINTQSIADYLAQLLKDKKQLAALPNVFHHVERLLDEGKHSLHSFFQLRINSFYIFMRPERGHFFLSQFWYASWPPGDRISRFFFLFFLKVEIFISLSFLLSLSLSLYPPFVIFLQQKFPDTILRP